MAEIAKSSTPNTPETSPAHQPLTPGKYSLLLLSAVAVIAAFYIYSLLSLLLVGIGIVLSVAVIILGYQGGIGLMLAGPTAHALSYLGLVILRSLNLKRGVDYEVLLKREDAPGLFALVEQTAQRVGVQPPQDIVLLHGDNAWVHLKGFRKGQGRSRLGIGYELLAVMSAGEIQAIIAHEMAHAKLIQRGYQGVAFKGMARIHQFVETLHAPPPLQQERVHKAYRRLAGWIGFIPEKLRDLGTRLVAAGSRQEEFKADRLAAEICGSEVCRLALIHTYTVAPRSSELSWRDHMLHIDAGDYLQWLRERLSAKDETDEAEAQNKALSDVRRSDFSTHPNLTDRLAALPVTTPTVPVSDAPAIHLLHDPEKMAARLLGELERIANEQEQKENRRLRKWIRKKGRSQHIAPIQLVGIVFWIGGIAGFLWLLGVTAEKGIGAALAESWATVLVTIALFVAGTLIYSRGGFQDSLTLPVPSFDQWDEALKAREKLVEEKLWRGPIAAELRAAVPPDIQGAKTLRRYWVEQCYAALAQCDYQRAEVASRLSLEADRTSVECLPGHCIGSAYFLGHGLAREAMAPFFQKYGIGPSVSWAVAWIDCLIGDWGSAELYLLDAVERRPEEATLHSLLAEAHWRTGKIREAMESSNRAVERAPDSPTHRLLRARILLAAGRLQNAREDLDWLQQRGESRVEFHLALVEAAVSAGQAEEARSRAVATLAAHEGCATKLRLAHEFVESNDDTMREQAKEYYEQVLQETFYPEACMGLARIAYERKDFETARGHLLAALNVEKERPDGASHPLSLFETVCAGLRSLDDNPVNCTIWNATLDVTAIAIEIKTVHLLTCHTSREKAVELILDIYMAIAPGTTWDESLVTLTELPQREQPKEPVLPGIYDHGFE